MRWCLDVGVLDALDDTDQAWHAGTVPRVAGRGGNQVGSASRAIGCPAADRVRGSEPERPRPGRPVDRGNRRRRPARGAPSRFRGHSLVSVGVPRWRVGPAHGPASVGPRSASRAGRERHGRADRHAHVSGRDLDGDVGRIARRQDARRRSAAAACGNGIRRHQQPDLAPGGWRSLDAGPRTAPARRTAGACSRLVAERSLHHVRIESRLRGWALRDLRRGRLRWRRRPGDRLSLECESRSVGARGKAIPLLVRVRRSDRRQVRRGRMSRYRDRPGAREDTPARHGEVTIAVRGYWPSCDRAARNGALETCTTPEYGVYISRIRKIAPDTDTAATIRLPIAVALKGAKIPKLTKMTVSQRTTTISNGMDTDAPACSYISHRVLPRSMARLSACAWSVRCASVAGESAWMRSKSASPAPEVRGAVGAAEPSDDHMVSSIRVTEP